MNGANVIRAAPRKSRTIRSTRCRFPFPIVCFVLTLRPRHPLHAGGHGRGRATNWLLRGRASCMGACGGCRTYRFLWRRSRPRTCRCAQAHARQRHRRGAEVVNLRASPEKSDFIGSTGVYISAVVVLILLYSGWKGGDLVFRHGVGVHDTSNL